MPYPVLLPLGRLSRRPSAVLGSLRSIVAHRQSFLLCPLRQFRQRIAPMCPASPVSLRRHRRFTLQFRSAAERSTLRHRRHLAWPILSLIPRRSHCRLPRRWLPCRRLCPPLEERRPVWLHRAGLLWRPTFPRPGLLLHVLAFFLFSPRRWRRASRHLLSHSRVRALRRG